MRSERWITIGPVGRTEIADLELDLTSRSD